MRLRPGARGPDVRQGAGYRVRRPGHHPLRGLTRKEGGRTRRRPSSLFADAPAIRYDLCTPGHFRLKGDHIANVIREWDLGPAYDFALPVDCDEFLAVFTSAGLSRARQDIHAAFDSLAGVTCALRVDLSLFNVPGRDGWYAPVRHVHKGFLPARTVLSCDKGHHEPRYRRNDAFQSTAFTYLHEHHRPYGAWRERLERKMDGLADLDDRDALLAYLERPAAEAAHAAASLLLTQTEYATLYAEEVLLRPGIGQSEIVSLRGPGWPMRMWDSAGYLAANPDVQAGYPIGPLQHYLHHGFGEGRLLAPAG